MIAMVAAMLLTQVTFQDANIVPNKGAYCGWCCVEMMLKHAGHDCGDLTARKRAAVAAGNADAFKQTYSTLIAEIERQGASCEGRRGVATDTVKDNTPFVERHLREGRPVMVVIKSGTTWHAVLVLMMTDDTVWVIDPDGGRRLMQRADFNERWCGQAIVVIK